MPQLTRRSLLSLAASTVPVWASARTASAQAVRRPTVVNGRRYRHYDVFTDKPLAGNQLAVFVETMGLTAAEMQAMTRETKFSECTCGSAFFMVPLASRAAVDQAVVDTRAVAAVFEAAKLTRRGLFIFSTEPGTDGATVYSRMMGANEDPATGSASGPLGCYLVKHGLVPPGKAGSIVSAQGVKMGRPSRIHIKLDVSGTDVTRVRVGGTSVLVGEGWLRSS